MRLPLSFPNIPDRLLQNRYLQLLVLICLALSSEGAASATQIPALDKVAAQDHRVASVVYRLAISNRGFCRNALVPQLGFVLESAESSGTSDAAWRGRRVTLVVEGSPAANAGLVSGDRLVSVNGVPLGIGSRSTTMQLSRIYLGRGDESLLSAISAGEVALRVDGQRGEHEIRFEADMGCPASAELVSSKDVNAWADGNRVLITSAIVNWCDSDAELAFVLAHEMSHNLLQHRQRLADAGISRNGLLPRSAAGSAMVRATEEEADMLAVRLTVASGYDLSRTALFLERLLNPATGPRRAAPSHPDTQRRLLLLKAAIAEFAL